MSLATRRERVILDLEDRFTAPMTRAATAAALLNRELNGLSGSSVQSSRSTQMIVRDVDKVGTSANRADTSINQLTGRLRLLADVATILGPALVPVGAIAVPAVAGLANQLGVAALAGGTAILAFQGVGDALKAVNDAALEPTTANLQKARDALDQLSPAARQLVGRLQELRPALDGLRDAAAEGLFPGLIEGLDALEARLPDVERILSSTATTLGDLLAGAGADLASGRWTEFFDFLATDAQDTLTMLGRTVGNLAHGMAELWVAFDPLNDDFSGWLLDVSKGFDSWAAGLAQTEGFAEFMDYVRTTGPQVADTFGALGDAVLQIVEAAAPLGGPTLQALEAVARVIASIADSPIGTPLLAAASALAVLSRATAVYGAVAKTAFGAGVVGPVKGMVSALGSVTTAQERAALSATALARAEAERSAALRAGLVAGAKGAAAIGALALASTGAADKMGLLNTATFALAGPMGAVAGLALDLKQATDGLSDSMGRAQQAFDAGQFEQAEAALRDVHRALEDALRVDMFDVRGQLERALDLDVRGLIAHGPLGDFVGLLRAKFGDAEGAAKELGEAIAAAAHRGDDLPALFGNLAPALGMTADQFGLAAMNARDLTAALAGLSGFLDKREALRNYQQALDDFAASVKSNGRSFDIATESGRANQQALDRIASSALQAASQLKGLDRVQTLTRATKDIRSLANELGVPLPRVQALIDRLQKAARMDAKPKVEVRGAEESSRKIDEVDKRFHVLDALMGGPTAKTVDKASGPLRSIAGLANSLNGKVSTVTIRTVRETVNRTINDVVRGVFPAFHNADGAVVDYYAHGGLREQHVAQIAPAGAYRVWAEPETGGEAYIPLAPSKRDRSRMIADEVVSRLGGGSVQWYADGGVTGDRDAVAVFTRSVRVSAAATVADTLALSAHRREVDGHKQALRAAKGAVEAQREAVDETKQALAGFRDAARSVADSIEQRYGSDIFGRGTDVELGDNIPADVRASILAFRNENALTSDIASLKATKAAIRALTSKGFDGAALADLLSNGDLSTVTQYAGMSKGQLAAFEKTYEQREALAASVGRTGGQAAWGADIRASRVEAQAQTAVLRKMETRLARLEKATRVDGPDRTAAGVGRAIQGAAAAAGRSRRA